MKKKNAEDLVLDIQQACAELGWHIALKEEDVVTGLIIGQSEYVEEIIGQVDDENDYQIWAHVKQAGEIH